MAGAAFFAAGADFFAGVDFFAVRLVPPGRRCRAASTLARSASMMSMTLVASGASSAAVTSTPLPLALMSS